LGGLSLMQVDYNNDGCMDIFIPRGGWEYPQRKSLLRNNCDGTFTDVTDASGLGATVTATQAAVWADIDNDGYLDLFLANENAPAQLFHNKGDGTFEEIGHAAGIDQTAFSKGVTAADYDHDGFMDFYVSNLQGKIISITTTATLPSPRSEGRLAYRLLCSALPHGFSTTTTTAGPTCLSTAI
jgi:hypothetical protein